MPLLAVWLLACPGCAFVFTGPDYSNVGDPVDSGTVDSDTDTEPPTEVDPDAPIVTSFVVAPVLRGVEFRFVIADRDGDLIGGEIVASAGADEVTWALPQDLVRFDADGESVAASDAVVLDCDRDYEETWTLTVTDRAGHRSPAVTADATLGALGELPENATAANPMEAGEVATPFVACVTFDGATQAALRNDEESFTFAPEVDGRYRIELDWPDAAADLDLFVYDDRDNVLGQGFTIQRPEVVELSLQAGETVRVEPQWYTAPDPLSPPYDALVLVSLD